MENKNKVFIGASIDGFIADKNGGLEFLDSVPNPDGIDMGYGDFMAGIDAIVMGRVTFETVCGFDIDWPFQVPVFVLSSRLVALPEKYADKAELVSGSLLEVLETIHKKGYHNLYIDGGKTIQSFLKENLIDEMTITTIPCLLGDGVPLFAKLPAMLKFECTSTRLFLDKVVQNRFERSR